MSEQEIIKACKKGDREAFNELIRMYQSKVANIAYGMVSDQNDALDAAQEVFIKVYTGISTFKGNSSLNTWIYRITVNVCNDILRGRLKNSVVTSIDATYDESDDPKNEIEDDTYSPDKYIETGEDQRAIREAIEEISPVNREVLVLCDIEGREYAEVSQILKIPEGTVKSRLNRARNILRKNLQK